MKFRNSVLALLLFMVLATPVAAQERLDPQTYDGDLIEYLTELNIWIEGHMLLNYCSCSTNKDFLISYQKVRAAYNAFLNSYIIELVLLSSRRAINNFEEINTSEFVNAEPNLNGAYTYLLEFGAVKAADCQDTTFLPTAITVTEIIKLSTSIFDIFDEARKRREEQKMVLIQTLENFKIPSSEAYECK